METLLISLTYYRRTLIFRSTLSNHRCYLSNVTLFIKCRCSLLNVTAIYYMLRLFI